MSEFYKEREQINNEASGIKQCKHCNQFLLKLNLSWKVKGYNTILRCHDCNICWGFNSFEITNVTHYIDLQAEENEQHQIDLYHTNLRRMTKKYLN